MSARKRKVAPVSSQQQTTFESILGTIARIKSKLADLGQKHERSALLDDLQRLAALAETFSQQRSRSKVSSEDADALDREGVHLWNASKLLAQASSDDEDRILLAALRLAGFRLVEAGIEEKPRIDALTNILQLAGKTSTALSDCGRNDVAGSILSSAARFDEQLRLSGENDDGSLEQAKTRAAVVYYCSRMVVAWKDGNDAIAQFMLEKITDPAFTNLSFVPSSDRELLAGKILEIGKAILRPPARATGESAAAAGMTEAMRALDAIKWIQKAFALVEKMEDVENSGIAELKRATLRVLVRAFYVSSSVEPENLVRAETTLQELLTSIEASPDKSNSSHHQLRWMRLSILKKRNASDHSLAEALESIIDHTVFGESEITEILQELRTFSSRPKLVSDALRQCLLRLLEGPPEASSFVDRVLLALLAHCAQDQDCGRAINDIDAGCSLMNRFEFELEKGPAMACLTILWKRGDRLYQMKHWIDAAQWFLLASLCYIEQKEYAQASHIIHRCPPNQSSTHYLLFLTAVHQGLEEEAISSLENMIKATDFDRRMLLLATQLSHDADLKSVLLAALEALLKTLQSHGPVNSEVEGICLARCIIRLVIRLMKEAIAENDRNALVVSLIRHFRTASEVVESAALGKSAPIIAKDVSWLWRTAFNIALQGCSEWQHAEAEISDLFELSCKLAFAYSQIAVNGPEADTYLYMAQAMYSCASARMFVVRYSLSPSDTTGKVPQYDFAMKTIREAKDVIIMARGKAVQAKDFDAALLTELLCSLQTFEAEIYYQRQEWDLLLRTVQNIGKDSASIQTFEAIADLVWSDGECPVHVLYAVLEALLHACLDQGSLSIEKFSRWLRAICSILLSRNTESDRTKAIGYVEQAITLLDNQNSTDTSQIYPIDERHWLLSTSYNTGVECLASSRLDEAKRWFEAATVVCRSVPDGVRQAEKISEAYQHLLEQYGPRHP